jgi:hypothetical protein
MSAPASVVSSMVFANTPDSSMRAASRELTHADFTDGSRETGED